MRKELRIPNIARAMFLVVVILVGLAASGNVAEDKLPSVYIAVALFSVATVVFCLLAVIRFRR